ncbi:hypothetical protein Taro_024980 [Colocasia esculenta]|uniref:DNA-directed RNA polymerase II protein n=1 Tax=Colocasia esculenta TaxID=4460 RepID=A0A843VJ53_COLES|nr:hypothetical protein [Colocasia esculenta]
MARRSGGGGSCSCAICEQSNLPSICAGCVNYRLNDYSASLRALKNVRDSHYARLKTELTAKNKADEQLNWRICQNEKLARLKERLHHLEEQLAQGKSKVNKTSHELEAREKLLGTAFDTLAKNRVELLEKFYPNLICTQSLGYMAITSERLHKQSVVIKQICKLFPLRRANSDGEKNDLASPFYHVCNARLPRALDPHSVPSEELAASLGYMAQLLNLVIPSLAAPALHNSGFAGSCSRIWQRDSYWDARPSSRSYEYPLFIPRQNFCSSTGENSWSDRSASNFGIASVESVRKPSLDAAGGTSFNYSSASPHSVETHKDLQKGISLLKKSVACVTAYCYNSLCLDLPSEASTFEAFRKLLATLSSSKEVRSVFSLKMAGPRSGKQVPMLNKSIWHVSSVISSGSLADSAHTAQFMRQHHLLHNNLSDSAASFLFAPEVAESGKFESLVEGWDIVEHPTFPPPPSQAEDIEHWTRAMIIDATKRYFCGVKTSVCSGGF